jgi:hypothetical protein
MLEKNEEIIWTDRVRDAEILHRAEKEMNEYPANNKNKEG